MPTGHIQGNPHYGSATSAMAAGSHPGHGVAERPADHVEEGRQLHRLGAYIVRPNAHGYEQITYVPEHEMMQLETHGTLNLAQLMQAQRGENAAVGVGAAESIYDVVDPVRDRLAAALRNHPAEQNQNSNTSRYLALAGIGILSAATITLATLYALLRKETSGESPSAGLPPDIQQQLREKIQGWLKATEKDDVFWGMFAKLVTDPEIKPPLTLTDNVPFCSYVIDQFPVASFLFDSADDATFYVMHLVAAYVAETGSGKSFGEGAAAMYRKITTFRYSAGGAPAAPFPRQVQALLLRQAFVALVYPSAAVDMMRFAVELVETGKPTDAEYWAKFAAYRPGTKERPPLTLVDEVQFCGYTAALSENTGFYFERKETEPDFIAQLVAKFDIQTKSTAGLYALAPTLSVTPGTPLPRRVQAQLLRAALTQLDTKDSGTGLPALVQQWAAKSDADYWAEFVKYKQAARPPLLLTEEIHFCTYTLRQFPVPAAYVPPTPDEREAFVTRLVNQYKTDSSTTGAYPLLTRLRDRPPQLPRAVQAQVMRLALMQISDAAGV